MTTAQVLLLVVVIAILIAQLAICFVLVRYLRLWIRAFLAGTPVPILTLIAMSLRRSDVRAIVENLIVASHGGVNTTVTEMEQAYLQKVDIEKVTLAAVEAKRQKMDLTFQDLVEAEMQGRLAEKLGMK